MIEVKFDDILKQDVAAIVNPANKLMLHGGGLAGIIAGAAGEELVKESQAKAPIETGQAIITTAGKLPFKAVIHTVGPDMRGIWSQEVSDGENPDEALGQAYRSAMGLAAAADLPSLAFPAVSCGVFRFPVERAAPIAIRAIREAQASFASGVKKVVICLLDEEHYKAFAEAEAAIPEEPSDAPADLMEAIAPMIQAAVRLESIGIYVMPTEENQPPRAVLGDFEGKEGEEVAGILVTWSPDMGAWLLGGVPVPRELGDVITQHAKDLGVEW